MTRRAARSRLREEGREVIDQAVRKLAQVTDQFHNPPPVSRLSLIEGYIEHEEVLYAPVKWAASVDEGERRRDTDLGDY